MAGQPCHAEAPPRTGRGPGPQEANRLTYLNFTLGVHPSRRGAKWGRQTRRLKNRGLDGNGPNALGLATQGPVDTSPWAPALAWHLHPGHRRCVCAYT